MRGGMNSRLMPEPGIADFQAERFQSPGSASGGGFQVTVVFTTRPGTQAALRMAGAFAKDLGARIRLVVAHEVPFHFPLDKPPVSLDFLERYQIRLVSESGVRAEEVHIEMFLCSDRAECLRRVLRPRSLVVVGGRRRRWLNSERRLEKWLGRLEHRVIFAEVEPQNHSGFIVQLRDSALLRWMRGWFERRKRHAVTIVEDPNNRSAL